MCISGLLFHNYHTQTLKNHATSEALIALLIRVPVFRDMALCNWHTGVLDGGGGLVI